MQAKVKKLVYFFNRLRVLIIIRIFGSNLGVRGKERGMFVQQGKTRYYVSEYLVPWDYIVFTRRFYEEPYLKQVGWRFFSTRLKKVFN